MGEGENAGGRDVWSPKKISDERNGLFSVLSEEGMGSYIIWRWFRGVEDAIILRTGRA